MARRLRIAGMASIALLAASTAARSGEESGWTKHTINDRSPYEAAGAFDVDGDGVLDIVSGASWYKGPDFASSYPIREITRQGTYYNDFATLPVDVNADGLTDFVTVSYFGKDIGWVENPGRAGDPWTYHEIDVPGPSEAAWMVDLTGDGVPEVLPNVVNVAVFYELENPGPDARWPEAHLGSQEAGHGVGTGDVNGDGRTDLLTPKGWFEAPADRSLRLLDLPRRVEPRRRRHPDPRPGRRRRRPRRRRLGHGPQLRPLLDQAGPRRPTASVPGPTA